VMSQPHSSNYSYVDALTWATDIAAAVSHLHSLNPVIIHRDLKLENILLLKPSAQGTAGGRKLPVAKLTDFGLHVVSAAVISVSSCVLRHVRLCSTWAYTCSSPAVSHGYQVSLPCMLCRRAMAAQPKEHDHTATYLCPSSMHHAVWPASNMLLGVSAVITT
jgi:serine/threonine protein kinase